MRYRRRYLLLLLLALCAGGYFGFRAWQRYTYRHRLPMEVREALLSSRSVVTLYSLKPLDYRRTEEGKIEPWPSEVSQFHGFPILGSHIPKDSQERDHIVSAVLKATETEGQNWKCFEPRHGVRVQTFWNTYDLVICFGCGHLYIHGIDSAEGFHLRIGHDGGALNQIFEEHQIPLGSVSDE